MHVMASMACRRPSPFMACSLYVGPHGPLALGFGIFLVHLLISLARQAWDFFTESTGHASQIDAVCDTIECMVFRIFFTLFHGPYSWFHGCSSAKSFLQTSMSIVALLCPGKDGYAQVPWFVHKSVHALCRLCFYAIVSVVSIAVLVLSVQAFLQQLRSRRNDLDVTIQDDMTT